MRFSLMLAALAVACSTDPAQPGAERVAIDGAIPSAADEADLVQAFLDSRAQFGVIVDPVTGDVVTLQNLDRASNSNDFSQIGSATCTDCGINTSCVGATGFQRQIEVSLVRNTGSGLVDINHTGSRNWSPSADLCNGSACPAADVDASGGPAPLDLVLLGSMNTCSSFGVFFDTDSAAQPDNQSTNATLSPAAGIIDNNLAFTCVDLTIPAGSGTVFGDMSVDLTMAHSWVGDLHFKLIAPDASEMSIMHRPGASHAGPDVQGSPFGTNADLVSISPIRFVDGAATSAEDMGLAGSPVCQVGPCEFAPAPDSAGGPASFADAFDGVAASGVWQFCARDLGAGDSGSISEVSLSFLSQP